MSDDDDDDPAEPPPPPASHATAAPQATRDRDQACTEADAGLKPLALVKFQLTSAIEDRQPVDELTAATAGERVWAYLSVDNRSADERCVTVTFRVNGKKRTSLSLDIGKSPTWRTWASQRLTKTDVGAELTVEVVDDQGKLLKEQALPVQESTPAGASATASARTSPPPPPASGP